MTTKTKLKSNICHFAIKKNISNKKQPKRSTLHKVTTLNKAQMIRQEAVEMEDTKLITKLSEAGMISCHAFHYHKCITGFTNL